MTLLLTLALAIPALAKPDNDRGRRGDDDKARVRITIQQNDANDDSRAYRSWYGAQVGRFNEIDRETGERIGDLLQLVADVDRDRIIVTDRDSVRRTVMLTGQTRVIDQSKGPGNGPGYGYLPNGRMADAARHVDKGDLVILNGYLKADGAFVASQIRVMGRVWGWGGNWNGGGNDYRPTYGERAWGEITSIDYRYGRIEVNGSLGRRTIMLQRGGEVLVKGQKQTIQFLRKGDRVVFYYRGETNPRYSIEVYRIVVLEKADACPEGNRPHCADPDYKPGHHDNAPNLPMLEARVTGVSTGTMFNKLTVITNAGKQVNVYVSKTVDAQDERGNRISLLNLRYNDRLCIYYTEVAGVMFAQQIEVR
ncbi:MAG: hypothetical protein BWY76_02142 [bacterium ADurb.Bin429]|nr:MAG: hypothetical protein BWY76_02142 [bacterium ADurb.Bin429]